MVAEVQLDVGSPVPQAATVTLALEPTPGTVVDVPAATTLYVELTVKLTSFIPAVKITGPPLPLMVVVYEVDDVRAPSRITEEAPVGKTVLVVATVEDVG